jgi:hypothetical protein
LQQHKLKGYMARRVFFSFHYQNDIFRVNVVRKSGVVVGSSAAGFQDASLWEKTKKRGPAAVRRLIDRGLEGTSVTCVLIGQKTANRKYVAYEIEQSVKKGNGLLGIHINDIPDMKRDTDFWQGEVPATLKKYNATIYSWNRSSFGDWVEKAYQRANEGPPKNILERIERLLR